MSDHGTFHWNELLSADVECAKAFYAETLGWEYEAFPMPGGGDYWIIMVDGKPAGGMMDMPKGADFISGPQWFEYIAVDDIDVRLEKVTQAGGKVINPPFDVPEVGRIAMVQDAGGANVGWITPAAQD